MQRRLAQLEGVARTAVLRQSRWDLELLDDDELAEMEVLSRKAEGAKRAGDAVIWTAEEEAALTRLGAKIDRDGMVSG